MRPAGSHVVLAGALDRDAEELPLGGPLQLPRQLAVAAERADAAAVPASGRPGHQVGPALIRHGFAVVVGRIRGADTAALLADGLERQPVVGTLGSAEPEVDLLHVCRGSQERIDDAVEPARPVDVAHAVETGVHAELVERAGGVIGRRVGSIEPLAGELAEVGLSHRIATKTLGRRGRPQRLAEVLHEVLTSSVRDLVNCVHVVAAVHERRIQAALAGHPGQCVVDQHTAQ